jgi:TM2 domain
MEESVKLNYDNLCKWCGGELKQPEGICPKCDVEDNGNKAVVNKQAYSKSDFASKRDFSKELNSNLIGSEWFITLMLSFFLGFLGAHRFYTGHMLIGFLQLLTFGGCGIWSTIDFFQIATNKYKDGKGNPLIRKK